MKTFANNTLFLCPVCGRECGLSEASRHHVLPKSQGGREIEIVCVECHQQIHALFGVKELARKFDTLDKLVAEPEMQTWIAWIRKRRPRQTRRATPHDRV